MFDLTASLLEANKPYERTKGRYNASELWGITHTDWNGNPYLTPEMWVENKQKEFPQVFRMWEGSNKHKAIQELFQYDQQLKDYEIEKKIEYKVNDNITLVAKADAIKDDILEIKTTNEVLYKAKPSHIYQLKLYLSIFEKPNGYIVQPIIRGDKLLLNIIGSSKRDDIFFKKECDKLIEFHKKVCLINK